jgi:exopolysaccharide biosynthesis polyprenyl glycosylphosphotransferase
MVLRKTNRAYPHVEVGGPAHRQLQRNSVTVSSHPGFSMHHRSGSVLPRTDQEADLSVQVDAAHTRLDVIAPHSVTPVGLELDAGARAIKRGMDIALASVGLVVLAPLLGLIALAIVLDSPGPVLFRQERIGKHGRPFVMLKFRTMISDRRERNVGPPEGLEERRRVHKSPNDPRITRIGRFLRRACLDELPQFWNVLIGDMSVVGPRPQIPPEVNNYEEWHYKRLAVSPGLTGLWQVSGRSELTFDEMVIYDIYYIENWSLGLDLQILARTGPAVLGGSGAF